MIETKSLIMCVAASSVLSSAGTAMLVSSQKSATTTASQTHSSQLVEQRISALEAELELLAKSPTLDKIAEFDVKKPEPRDSLAETKTEPETTASASVSPTELRRQRREQYLARLQPDYRTQQFIEAGFGREEAARIIQLEERESLRQLDQQYQSQRELFEAQDASLLTSNPLRAELGDQNYERYLEANGWPTSAAVDTVLSGSPGANAGLQAGDKIVAYASERVFSLSDLTILTAQGQVGKNVLIEVERNGEQVQLSIPRGPIGITSGRRGPRR